MPHLSHFAFIVSLSALACSCTNSSQREGTNPDAGSTAETTTSSDSNATRDTTNPANDTSSKTSAGSSATRDDALVTQGDGSDATIDGAVAGDAALDAGAALVDASTDAPLSSDAASKPEDATTPNDQLHSSPLECVAIALNCGARVHHSTAELSDGNVWSGYGSSARLESGKEVLYRIDAAGCNIKVVMSQLEVDLDLFLLTSCEPNDASTTDFVSVDSELASSTPLDLQTVEQLAFTVGPANGAFFVVDGYAGAEGSYTLDVECTCR